MSAAETLQFQRGYYVLFVFPCLGPIDLKQKLFKGNKTHSEKPCSRLNLLKTLMP